MTGSNDREPLLQGVTGVAAEDASTYTMPHTERSLRNSNIKNVTTLLRRFLASEYGHISVLLLVTLDVSCIFANICIELHICGLAHPAQAWTEALKALGIISLVFSSLFVAELLASTWAFGSA